ncbi:hypothetical protein BCR35DRAFT_309765 [Leucosporidium creatinivorum]|uniref:RRM domain-containing protein n=1 Tax=Leucosporidium creatinivorum TaxID=106004 RepID=A0A1Y2DC21_9BASI|nr:hypothetical protein BCR35DRAFT_309765 [Leucosporidium creatinivorum]
MPPKKGKKVNLADFLADESTGGSWADEMDELPTGPSGERPDGPGLGGSHLSRNQRDGGFGGSGGGFDRPERAEVPFPTAPPYTAFVGNLTFETIDTDLEGFFTGLETTSIRLVSGPDGKPKGFGYVEFATSDGLRSALTQSGLDLNGRTVRISVAEAPSHREGRADAESTWTRTGPLQALPGRSGGFGGGARTGGFGSPREGESEVEREGPIRGGKFTPSAPTPARTGFGGGGFGGAREGGFQAAPQVEVEREGPIRGGKFTPSAPAPERRQVEPSRADEEKTWSRTGPLPPAPGQERRTGGFGFGRDQGARGSFGDRTPPSAPAERRPLNLSARSTSNSGTSTPASGTTSPPTTTSRPSPFGTAKPVDSAVRAQEIEAKLAKERAEAVEAKLKVVKEKRDGAASPGASAREQKEQKEREQEERISKARLEASKVKDVPAASKEEGDDTWTTVAKGAQQAKDAAVAAVKAAPAIVKGSFGGLKDDEGVEEVTKGVEETKV